MKCVTVHLRIYALVFIIFLDRGFRSVTSGFLVVVNVVISAAEKNISTMLPHNALNENVLCKLVIFFFYFAKFLFDM